MSRGFPSMTALLGLLAVAGFQNRDKIAEMLRGQMGGSPGAPTRPGQSGQAHQPAGTPRPDMAGDTGPGGLLGGLGGAAAGGGLGGLLGGGLGELVERFRQNGKGDLADSWIGSGPNREAAPQDLEEAIGPDILATLVEQTGLSREEIVSRLSRDLPTAVDQFTPEGKIPV
jgi:uncharacterized protein YidB (DUF937 family)